MSENTLRALLELDKWLDTDLSDAVLAEYITELHQSGKSPSTISQVIAAVKWTGSSGKTLSGVQFCQSQPDIGGAIKGANNDRSSEWITSAIEIPVKPNYLAPIFSLQRIEGGVERTFPSYSS